MGTVTIQEVLSSEDWDAKDGSGKKFTSFKVRFDGEQAKGIAKLTRLRGSAPAIGESFDGEVVAKGGEQVLKKVKVPFSAPQGGSGALRSNGGGGEYLKDKSPSEKASVARAHAQDMALRHAQILHFRRQLPDDYGFEWLIEAIEWFEADARDAGLRAELPSA